MKYLIVSNYDTGSTFSVNVNGKDATDEIYDDIQSIYNNNPGWFELDKYPEIIYEKYKNDFDLIVICENGIIKTFDTTKNAESTISDKDETPGKKIILEYLKDEKGNPIFKSITSMKYPDIKDYKK